MARIGACQSPNCTSTSDQPPCCSAQAAVSPPMPPPTINALPLSPSATRFSYPCCYAGCPDGGLLPRSDVEFLHVQTAHAQVVYGEFVNVAFPDREAAYDERTYRY